MASAAAEQPAEVAPRVVLRQAAHVRDGIAGPENRFKAHELCPRGAMAEHLEPTRVGGGGATDRRAVTTAEIDAVGPAGGGCGRLNVGHRPGTNRELASQRVDVADARQPAETEYDLAGEGNASPDQPCVAPLGHEGDAGLFAQGHDRCDLTAVPRSDDGAGVTSKTPSPIDGVRGHHFGFDN